MFRLLSNMIELHLIVTLAGTYYFENCIKVTFKLGLSKIWQHMLN